MHLTSMNEHNTPQRDQQNSSTQDSTSAQQTLTKKQRRALKREHKLASRDEMREKAKQKSRMIWFGFIVLIIAVVVGMNFLAKKGSDNAPLTPNEDCTIISTDIDPAEEWIKGNPSSAVTLFEYSDFQCPACAAQYPLVKQVAEEFGEQIRIVYRHYPLTSIHRNAEEAAYAAEAAGKQGMFWEYHDILFEEQGSWSNIGDPDDTFID